MNANTRQKIILPLLVIVLIFLVWQIYKIAVPRNGDSSLNTTTSSTMATAQQAPKVVAPAPVAFKAQKQAGFTDPAQAKYLQLVNRYQLMMMERMVAESSQAIAEAKLKAAQAQTELDKLAPHPARLMPSMSGAKVEKSGFRLVYTGRQGGRWFATIRGEEGLIDLAMGDRVPGLGRVVSINNKSVTLRKGGLSNVITFSGERKGKTTVIKKFSQTAPATITPAPKVVPLAVVKPQVQQQQKMQPKITVTLQKPKLANKALSSQTIINHNKDKNNLLDLNNRKPVANSAPKEIKTSKVTRQKPKLANKALPSQTITNHNKDKSNLPNVNNKKQIVSSAPTEVKTSIVRKVEIKQPESISAALVPQIMIRQKNKENSLVHQTPKINTPKVALPMPQFPKKAQKQKTAQHNNAVKSPQTAKAEVKSPQLKVLSKAQARKMMPVQVGTGVVGKFEWNPAASKKIASNNGLTENKILTLNPSYFTVQVIGDTKLKTVKQFITNHDLQGNTNIYQTVRNGKNWYVGIMGEYKSVGKAVKAIEYLPLSVKRFKPFIHRIRIVQNIIKTKNAKKQVA